jgi:hypothetical protein
MLSVIKRIGRRDVRPDGVRALHVVRLPTWRHQSRRMPTRSS